MLVLMSNRVHLLLTPDYRRQRDAMA